MVPEPARPTGQPMAKNRGWASSEDLHFVNADNLNKKHSGAPNRPNICYDLDEERHFRIAELPPMLEDRDDRKGRRASVSNQEVQDGNESSSNPIKTLEFHRQDT